jgi:hypothetical protein
VPPPSTPPRIANPAGRAEVVQALYRIAVPSPLRKTASRRALEEENSQLRRIALEAGIELERDHAQMILMDAENGRLRQKLHAKKNKPKRAYTTGHARLMTGDEMLAELLRDSQKKQMAALEKEMKKKAFPAIKAKIAAAEKAAKTAAKEAAKAARAAERGRGRGRGPAPAPARANGGGRRGGGNRARGGGGRVRGGGARTLGGGAARGGRRAQDDADSDDDDSLSVPNFDSDDQASDTSGSSDAIPSPSSSSCLSPCPSRSPSPNLPTVENEDDEDDEAGETRIVTINGHQWEARRNLQFQVVWTDGDITWEPFSNVNDCAALDDYLAHRDIDDPLLLSKRKYLINPRLK